jgi:hypothetical protein
LLVVIVANDVDVLGGAEQGRATTRNDAFFDSGAGCVQGVVDAVLTLFHFDFGCAADLDHGNTASQLGKAFLQFLTVIVGRGVFDLLADLRHASFDVFLLAGAVDDGRVVLVDGNALGFAQHVHRDVFQLDAEVFGDDLAAGEDAMSCSMALRRSPKPELSRQRFSGHHAAC